MARKGNKNAEKVVDWEKIDDLLKINATQEEIEAVTGRDWKTLNSHCKKKKKCSFSEYMKKGKSDYKVSLRRVQTRSALGIPKRDSETGQVSGWLQPPNVTMQIWLGKQDLGQSDKVEQVVTTHNGDIDSKLAVFAKQEGLTLDEFKEREGIT